MLNCMTTPQFNNWSYFWYRNGQKEKSLKQIKKQKGFFYSIISPTNFKSHDWKKKDIQEVELRYS